MPTATIVPVEVYLNKTYRPDCDYIDGEVRERNLGEQPHSSVQKFFIGYLLAREEEWGLRVFPEQRVQVKATNYRVADICVVLRSTPFEPIVRTPPLLCIEVVSRDDTPKDMQERVDDYIRMGVHTVWVVDPRKRRCFLADRSETMEIETDMLTVSETEVAVPVRKIFLELDEIEGVRQ